MPQIFKEPRIELRRQLSANEWTHLTGWRDNVFPDEGRGISWVHSDWHLLAFMDADLPVAHLGLVQASVYQGDKATRVAGVGGVVVRPEYQRQKIPAALFDYVHHETPTLLGTNVFTLFCPKRLVPYYQRHGYQPHRARVFFLQLEQSTLSPMAFMLRGERLDADRDLRIDGHPW